MVVAFIGMLWRHAFEKVGEYFPSGIDLTKAALLEQVDCARSLSSEKHIF